MKATFRSVDMLVRFLGVLLPLAATLILVELGDRFFGNSVSGVDFLRLLALAGGIGVLTGMLVRWWWAVMLVPCEIIAMIAVVYAIDALDGGINEGLGGDPLPLGAVLVFIAGPFLIAAALGAALGIKIGKRAQ